MRQLNAMEDFRREISHRLLLREDGTILLSATLNDRFHDILMEVVVEYETMTIRSARVEFRKAPSPDCPHVAGRVEQLAGVVIGRGLNRKLMELLGGGDGCGNLRNLLLGLLPLALNVKAGAGITDDEELLETIHNRLMGVCVGYSRPAPSHQTGCGTHPVTNTASSSGGSALLK